jgi:putative ABC transport system permease protein
MLSLQRTLSVGYIARHPTRTALVVGIIAMGVAVLVASRSLNASLNQAAKGAVNPFAAMADLLVVNGQTGVPYNLADRLIDAHLDGLAAVRPLVHGRAVLSELDDQSVEIVGVNATGSDDGLTDVDNPWGFHIDWEIGAGDFGDDPVQITLKALEFWNAKRALVGAKLAERMRPLPEGIRQFHVRRAAGKEQPFRGMGVVHLGEAAQLLEEDGLFMDIQTAAPLVYPQRPDYVTQLNLKLAPGADGEKVRREVDDYLKAHGEAAEVQTVEANEAMVRDVTAGLELGFSIVGYCALVVGLFLVYMILSVSVEERRHDIGVLRSLGATRGQVAGQFVGEAALLGLVGSLLGLPVGYGLAWLYVGPIRKAVSEIAVPIGAGGVAIDPGLMALAAAAGVATAVVAALTPAAYAAEERPADAVRRAPRGARPLWAAAQLAVAAALLGAGAACALLRDRLPARAGSFGPVVFLLLAALWAMPLLSTAVGRLFQPFFRYFFGLEGRLAADNLVRSPVRTGIVVAALAATGGLMVQTAGFIHSSRTAINDWIDDSIAADLYVTAGSSIDKAGFALPMDESVGRRLAGRPDVEAALPVRFHYFNYQGQFAYLIAVDVDAFHGADAGRAMARNLGRYPQLKRPGAALVSENFAQLHHVGVGDHVRIPGRSARELDLEIVGTIVDYTWNRGTVVVDRAWYAEEFGDTQVDVFDVYLKPGADAAAVQADLSRPDGWARKEAVFVATRDELHAAVAEQLQRLYDLAYAQQFVVGLVALMGVIAALVISVLQRRRELGLLRAVGASRGQVLWSVLAEATLMGLVGAAIGAVVGLALEWYLLRIVLFDEAGFVFPVLVPWAGGGLVLGLCVALATVVGLWPAWMATRLRIPEAIAYE